MNFILIGFALYFVIVGCITLISYMTIRKNTESYGQVLLGNRSVNYVLTALSAHASDMSDWLFMAFPAALYTNGLVSAWIAVGLICGMWITWKYVAPELRKATEAYGALTLSSYFEHRFSDTSGMLRLVSAIICFFFFSIYAPQYSSNTTTQNFFFNIPIIAFGLPGFLIPLSGTVVVLLAALVFFKVILKKKKEHGLWPSQNFLVPWIAFHIWWIPLIRQSEYYFLAIPFFHSLQYLPFAYRLEKGNRKKEWSSVKSGIAVAVLLLIGISAFELVPGLLDEAMESVWYFKTWFFLIAFAVFINVHHFFIDSTLWKFNHPDVRRGLL